MKYSILILQSSDESDGSKNKSTSRTSKNEDQKCNNTLSLSSNTSTKVRYNNEGNGEENMPPIANNSPDSGFINTLRYGMLAVRLLPRSSISSKIFILCSKYFISRNSLLYLKTTFF